MLNNFFQWLSEGWDIFFSLFMWLFTGIAWLMIIFLVYFSLVLLSFLFWRNETGRELRKSCLAHIIVLLVIPGILALICMKCCSSNSSSPKTNSLMSNPSSSYVYICTGPKSHKYHTDEYCKGLSSCSGDIIRMDIEEAYDSGYTPCKWCATN